MFINEIIFQCLAWLTSDPNGLLKEILRSTYHPDYVTSKTVTQEQVNETCAAVRFQMTMIENNSRDTATRNFKPTHLQPLNHRCTFSSEFGDVNTRRMRRIGDFSDPGSNDFPMDVLTPSDNLAMSLGACNLIWLWLLRGLALQYHCTNAV